MTCPAKHTKPQIPDADWRCPKCRASVDGHLGGFVLDEVDPDASDDCGDLLHDADTVLCYECGYGASGKALARLYAKQKNLVACPTCKGAGVVAGKR